MWVRNHSLEEIKHETEIQNDHTMVDWANLLREVCGNHEIAHFRQLGGFDGQGVPIVVEIDESKYFHRKYHRGNWREGHWVLGAVERGSSHCVLREVQNRDARTLEPIITQWCLPGTRIIADAWAGYNNLHALNNGVYLHDVVVHRHNFVDPIHPDVHTNTIEGMWMHGKRKLRYQFGTSRNIFHSYLDEFMWRWNGGHKQFGELVLSIQELYPV